MELTEKSKLKRRISILENQVKELQASLRRLNNNIYKEPAKEDLHDLIRLRKNLAEYFDISIHLMTCKSKETPLVNYRHAFIWEAYKRYKFNYKQIGSAVNMKQQSVYSALKNLPLRLKNYPSFEKIINELKDIEL